MPPRTTQKSHRPRVSDRTMVGNCHPLLASAKDAAGRTQKNMTPRTSHKGEKQNHALEECIAAANRGWMSEKYLPPADQAKCFFLTSPFIEPADHGVRLQRGGAARFGVERSDACPTQRKVLLGREAGGLLREWRSALRASGLARNRTDALGARGLLRYGSRQASGQSRKVLKSSSSTVTACIGNQYRHL